MATRPAGCAGCVGGACSGGDLGGFVHGADDAVFGGHHGQVGHAAQGGAAFFRGGEQVNGLLVGVDHLFRVDRVQFLLFDGDIAALEIGKSGMLAATLA